MPGCLALVSGNTLIYVDRTKTLTPPKETLQKAMQEQEQEQQGSNRTGKQQDIAEPKEPIEREAKQINNGKHHNRSQNHLSHG
jgi:hypothetical protein